MRWLVGCSLRFRYLVILGGLATSTLLNLFVLPVLYLSIGRRRRPGPSHS